MNTATRDWSAQWHNGAMELDHLVIAARSLEEGSAFIAEQLGVETVPGGQHVRLGTHNRLLGLGPGIYLEVIAIDPQGAAPFQPRWFALDDPAMHERLQSGPQLIHWVARSSDIETDAARSPVPTGPIHPMERGTLKWRITIPADGHLPAGGVVPTLIQWDVDDHPSRRLPESGCGVKSLTGWSDQLNQVFGYSPIVRIGPISRGHSPLLEAVFSTPRGEVVLHN
jgi:Glyoxalase-like domain